MIKAIAIDDEPLALKVIEVYCESLPNIALKKTFSKLVNAKKYLNKFPVDVIFLDIEMPKHNGIDFYKSLSQNVKVIFTTAYSEYAVEGFEVNATDYLLKPFSLERFTKSVNRLEKNNTENNNQTNTHLSIRANYKLNRIKLSEILFIEAMNDYIKIHLNEEKDIVARYTMKKILTEIPSNQFIRIHKSFIIPLSNIKSVEKDQVNLGYKTLPIGNNYRKKIYEIVKN